MEIITTQDLINKVATFIIEITIGIILIQRSVNKFTISIKINHKPNILFQQQHLPGLNKLSSLYSGQVDTSTHWSAKLISTVPDSYIVASIL